MSNQFWDANSVAGSGEMWSTNLNERVHNRGLFGQEFECSFNNIPATHSTHSTHTETEPMSAVYDRMVDIIQNTFEAPDYRTMMALWEDGVIDKNIKNIFSLAEGDYAEMVEQDINKKIHDILKSKFI